MPYINIMTNKSTTPETKNIIEKQFGQIIDLIPNKKKWLMVSFNEDRHICFQDSYDDAALVEVKLFGSAQDEVYSTFTTEITALISKAYDIPAARIYISYWETPYWGWNGKNF